VARAATALGLEVRGYDQRGFGRSAGARGTVPHPEALVDDAAELFARYADERRAAGDAAPPFVLGHSMGGCVVARAVTSGRLRPRGVVLSSPALAPRMRAADRWAAAAGERLFPNLRVPHRLPMHRLSHDEAVAAAVAADADAHDRITPRLAGFMRRAGAAAIAEAARRRGPRTRRPPPPAAGITPRLAAFMRRAGAAASADAARCTVPTLLLVAGDDAFVDPDGARRFHAALPAGVGTLRVYDALYHEVFNERAEDRAAVLADLAAWLRARLAA
jgi:alpha-beta hydrolase superfamily lysophospholipase